MTKIPSIEELAEMVDLDFSDDEIDETDSVGILRQDLLHGSCDSFAVALHRIFGWPIRSVSSNEGPLHRLVECPDGRLLDAAGYVTVESLKERYGVRRITLSQHGDETAAIGLGGDDEVFRAAAATLYFEEPPFSGDWFRDRVRKFIESWSA